MKPRGDGEALNREVEEQIEELKNRIRKTPYGDVGLVFTMKEGKVALIKPINLPLIKPGSRNGNG